MNRTALVVAATLASLRTPALAQITSLNDLTTIHDARSRRIASNSTDPESNADNKWIKAGDTLTLADIKCPGVIRHIWVTFPESSPSWISKEGCADPSELVLR